MIYRVIDIFGYIWVETKSPARLEREYASLKEDLKVGEPFFRVVTLKIL